MHNLVERLLSGDRRALARMVTLIENEAPPARRYLSELHQYAGRAHLVGVTGAPGAGNRAYKDEDGYFWFVGRADDVIISAGYRIGPFEVESALKEHPAVAESAVVASPDERRGEIVKAFVILAPAYQPSAALASELQEHVKRVTAPYKYPREIEFVESLPKTVSGKIRRVELREMERNKKQGVYYSPCHIF